MRLFIFESHPVQYHAPVYRELHRLCQADGGSSIRVFYATDISVRGHFDSGFGSTIAWDEPLLNGYPATVLNAENGIPLNGFNSLTGKGIVSLLKRERPDAVMLAGLAHRFEWAVYWTAIRLRIPIWLRTETQDEAFARGRVKSILRSIFYRLAYAPVSKALVIGRLNAQHYQRHGLPSRRHVLSPYCVVDRFKAVSPAQKSARRRELRREAGFGDQTTVLLFCGKLQPKKQPGILLEALSKLSATERRRFGVLYVGSGELEAELRLAASALKDVKVWFAGFKNQTEIAPYYLAADVLVLPSRQMGETWGLVANEGLLAECRVVLSRHVGCQADFKVLPGVKVFDGSTDGLVRALRQLPPSSSVANQRNFMRRYSIDSAAQGIARAMGLAEPAHAPARDLSSIESRPAMEKAGVQ
ncbi:MAG TPA: glycosyltransferase family 4 protein [Verrucomicrobiae bacterium]|nr:glycosyltransferase family 4 protein [Verrucomicrobiae bacterium]